VVSFASGRLAQLKTRSRKTVTVRSTHAGYAHALFRELAGRVVALRGQGRWDGLLDIILGIAAKLLGMSSPVFRASSARDQLTSTIATNEPD
jgi:hypothetical protein